jgi:hypothetical protein
LVLHVLKHGCCRLRTPLPPLLLLLLLLLTSFVLRLQYRLLLLLLYCLVSFHLCCRCMLLLLGKLQRCCCHSCSCICSRWQPLLAIGTLQWRLP